MNGFNESRRYREKSKPARTIEFDRSTIGIDSGSLAVLFTIVLLASNTFPFRSTYSGIVRG
jgi:hypothetical protein